MTEREELAEFLIDTHMVSSIDGLDLADAFLARYQLVPVECGAKEEWDRPESKGWHLCTSPIGHKGDHYCDQDFKRWPHES